MESENELEKRWAELYVRAKMMLDDEGLAQEEKRKDVAAKKLRRAGLEAPPVDLQKVKATLLKYAECMKYSEAVKATGIMKSDMACAFDLWPEAKTVEEYICRVRDEEYERKRADVVSGLREQMEKLALDDKGECKANIKAIMFGLQNLDRRRFGEAVSDGDDAERRVLPSRNGGILINIQGDAAKVCAVAPNPEALDNKAAVFIDV